MNRALRIVNGKQGVEKEIEELAKAKLVDELCKEPEFASALDTVSTLLKDGVEESQLYETAALEALAIIKDSGAEIWTIILDEVKKACSEVNTKKLIQQVLALEEEEASESIPEEAEEGIPCPDILWQGMFQKVAELVGERSWETWLGIYAALSAIANRQLDFGYNRGNRIYGMSYSLLINPTGRGKSLVMNLCRALLPDGYTVRRTLQSGEAVVPLLTEDRQDQQGQRGVVARPAILLMDEYTRGLKTALIPNSTLPETLNELFWPKHDWTYNVSRRSGGETIIKNPTLTICGVTTPRLLRQYITPTMLASGFLNRYLVLPGSSNPWKDYDPSGAEDRITRFKSRLKNACFKLWKSGEMWSGNNMWAAYNFRAMRIRRNWGRRRIEPLMKNDTPEAEALARLHVYSHHIAMIYAWAEGKRVIESQHARASIEVCETAYETMLTLLAAPSEGEIPQRVQHELGLEEEIIRLVKAKQGIQKRDVTNKISKKRKYTSRQITNAIEDLIKAGRFTCVPEKGKGNRPKLCLYTRA